MPDCSVLISTYGVPQYLRQCVESLRAQTAAADIEILVGIDGCPDTLTDVTRSDGFYQGCRMFHFPTNVGSFPVRNTLAAYAKSDRPLFFDSDDLAHPNMVARYVAQPEPVVRFRFFNFVGTTPKLRASHPKWAFGVIGVHADTFNLLGGYMPWRCAADSELWQRIVHHGLPVGHPPGISFYRRIHDLNLTRRADTGMDSELRAGYKAELVERIADGRWPSPEPVVWDHHELDM